MHMICHQDIGMNRKFMELCSLLQTIQIEMVVIACRKDRLTIISPLDDVLSLTFDKVTRKTCHDICFRANKIKSLTEVLS